MIDSELDAEAVALARKLEAFQRRRGERRSFIATMQELLASHRPSAEMLEFLAELFNASNRETDYAQALLKLFDLYCTKHDYPESGASVWTGRRKWIRTSRDIRNGWKRCAARSTISAST